MSALYHRDPPTSPTLAAGASAAVRGQPPWSFWLYWMAANTIAFSLAATAQLVGLGAYGVNFVVGAALAGSLQWLILRPWVSFAGWWVLVGVAGFILGLLAMSCGMNAALWAVGGESGTALALGLAFAGAFAFGGAVAGALQLLVLRRWVGGAGWSWWVLASGISWAVAGSVYMNVTRGNDVALLQGGTAGGAMSGAITGLTLVWLLRTQKREVPLAVTAARA
jgi:hypothetical protein